MDIRYVEDTEGLNALRAAIESTDRLALDLEAAGYHRYSDRVCLIQVTVGRRTFLVDPFEVDASKALTAPLQSEDVTVVMHGADFDLRLLDRDLDIQLRGLFDTQVAASLLGADAIGLSSLLSDRLGVEISKKYQKADWAKRPISDPMRKYAALDTAHLCDLADGLTEELETHGRLEWATEECRALEAIRFEEPEERDPVTRFRAARSLDARQVDRLRIAIEWRDELAQARDRAVFRIAGDDVLVKIAETNPRDPRSLGEIKGMNQDLASTHGGELLRRLAEVDRLPERDLVGYPRDARRNGGRERPSPEVEDRVAKLKAVRNQRAAALGVDRGTLLPNAVLQLIAEASPKEPQDIAGIAGLRRWQLVELAEDLIAAL